MQQVCCRLPVSWAKCPRYPLNRRLGVPPGSLWIFRRIEESFADDQIMMATSEDELQTTAYHLNIMARKYRMTTSSTKTKSMATCGNHIQRVKVVTNENIIEQVTYFKYLGYCISEYKSDLRVEDKLHTRK